MVFGSRGGEGVRAPSPLDTDEDAGTTLLSISEEVDETAVELAKVLPVEVLVKGEQEGVDEFVIPRAGSAKLVRFGIANLLGVCFVTEFQSCQDVGKVDGNFF